MPVGVLFVHESKHIDPTCPIHLMPMGVMSMVNWLGRNGIRSEVIHHAIELALDPSFDVVEAVRASGARLVCLPLHWHATSRNVINLGREIKRACPEVKLCLGGYTASAFSDEILAEFPHVDFVIRGDGEVAILALARHLLEGAPLESVPNLARLEAGRLVVGAESHVNDAEDLGRYEYCAFERLRHWPYYCQRGLMEGRIELDRREPGIFYCNAGRGCPFDCTFCGGGRSAQRFIAGRQKIAWRPVAAMLEDLLRMPRYGLDTWYNTFQPSPDESWFLELFEAIRASGLRIKMIQECLHLPTVEFLAAFARTFEPKSRLDFVVYSGNDELRRRNKHNYFSAADVLGTLDEVERLGIHADLCFLTGLPGEELAHFADHFAFISTVRARYRRVSVNAEILAIEPRAPMNLDPEGHGIRSQARRFVDYHRLHAEPSFIGFEPGAYDASTAMLLARYTRVAHRCSAPTCRFADALAAEPKRLTEVPVARWKEPCRACDGFARCFPSSELEAAQ